MPDEPPNIDSNGERPTRFGEGPDDRNPEAGQQVPKPDQSGKFGPPPSDFRIPSSDGKLDTYQAEKELSRFVSDGTELPPELVEEQRAVLLKPGDVVADRFEVVKQLGFGGMGAVYHVRDRYTRQDRALKVMLPSLLRSHAARERFRFEVTISQKLSHDKIVRVHDLAADRKRKFYFFTMELVEGKTLNRLLRERGGKLPLNEALDIVRQLCDALEYAHQHTIHRDLKPQNIMIRPDGSIKVLDFGLAKLMSPGRMTRSSMALGTVYYHAPEQSIHLSELDERADIYSVGVILYQMLTGEIPAGRFEPLARVVRELPKHLSEVVDGCLDPKPEGRPSSAQALRQALRQAAKVNPPKWLLPVVAAAAILAVILIAVKLGTVPSESREARDETGLSPNAPVPSESPPPSEESEPPLPEPFPESGNLSIEPSATAAEASTARQAAVAAQQAAQSVGAEEHAQGLWDEAVKQLKQAEAHDTLEAFDDAISGYETAANAFKEAETEAARIASEMKVLEEVQQAMAVVKAEADAFDAALYAKVRYEQAVKAEEAAAGIADDRVAAAGAYRKAAQLYQLAVDETKQQGAAIVAAAKRGAEAALTKTVAFAAGLSLELAWIPPGEFAVGSPSSEAYRDDDETQQTVRIMPGLWMGKYEVTQAQWQAVMGNNPSKFKSDNLPVEQVSWDDCQEFLGKVNARFTGGRLRLPTEAEWEYACRAGSVTAYCFGDDAPQLGDYGWYDKNSGGKTHPVGQKKANAWGLYDMHGNVYEWCEDLYEKDFSSKSSIGSPRNTSTETNRVLRGGSWGSDGRYCRSANRSWGFPRNTGNVCGFRVVCESSR